MKTHTVRHGIHVTVVHHIKIHPVFGHPPIFHKPKQFQFVIDDTVIYRNKGVQIAGMLSEALHWKSQMRIAAQHIEIVIRGMIEQFLCPSAMCRVLTVVIAVDCSGHKMNGHGRG